MKVKVNAHISTAAILKSRGLGGSSAARRHLANTVRRLSDPYVPMQQGTLKNTAQIDAEGKSITYGQPYARYQYYGEVYGPNVLTKVGWRSMARKGGKRPTGRGIKYHQAPMRGAYWDKRMMQARGNEVVDDLAKFVGGKRK